MSSEYRKNEFIKWFFIPIIIFVIVSLAIFFTASGEKNALNPAIGISGLFSLLISLILLFANLKIKERLQGILLSFAVLLLLTYFSCFQIPAPY